ncbi:hypothetical protein D3C72_2143760 [compost metagenome]
MDPKLLRYGALTSQVSSAICWRGTRSAIEPTMPSLGARRGDADFNASIRGSMTPGMARSQPMRSHASVSQIAAAEKPSCTITWPPSMRVASEWSVAAIWKKGDQAMNPSSPPMPYSLA